MPDQCFVLIMQLGATEGAQPTSTEDTDSNDVEFLNAIKAHRNFFVMSQCSALQHYFQVRVNTNGSKEPDKCMYSGTANDMSKTKSLTGMKIASSKMKLGGDTGQAAADSELVPVCDWTVKDAVAYPMETISSGGFLLFSRCSSLHA